MGLILPFYSMIFVVFKSTLSQIIFNIGCILAGIIIGAVSYFIGNKTILKGLNSVSLKLYDISRNKDLSQKLDIGSEDEIGESIKNFDFFIFK